MGAATRRRGYGTVAEVVTSVDVTVLLAVGDVAHVNLLTFGFLSNQGHCTLPQHFLCMLSVLFSILSKNIRTPPDGREIFLDTERKERKAFFRQTRKEELWFFPKMHCILCTIQNPCP